MGRIERIEIRGLEYEAGPLNRDRWGSREQACMISIATEDHVGYAMSRCNLGLTHASISEWLIRYIGPQLLGRSTSEHERLYDSLLRDYNTQFLPVFPLSVVDVALWDLRGVEADRSVAELLTEAPAATIGAYASIPRFDDVAAGLQEALTQDAAGFAGIKVHYSGDLDRDADLSRRIREALPETQLSFDAASALDWDQALRIGSLFVDLNGAWLEEPFAAFDFERNRRLRDRLRPLPLVGFETAPGGAQAARLAINSGAFDLIEIDCLWKGGITGAWRVAGIAQEAGQRVAIHHGGSPSMNLANIQLVAAAPNVDMIGLTTPVLDYNRAAVIPELDPTTRELRVPKRPGLGHEIDWEFVNDHELFSTTLTA